jgi:hypothetical protein
MRAGFASTSAASISGLRSFPVRANSVGGIGIFMPNHEPDRVGVTSPQPVQLAPSSD